MDYTKKIKKTDAYDSYSLFSTVDEISREHGIGFFPLVRQSHCVLFNETMESTGGLHDDAVEHCHMTSQEEDVLTKHKRVGTSEGYRERCKRDGWTSSKDVSLYPECDPCLQSLLDEDGLWPFEKHLPGHVGPYETLTHGGFVTGKEAILGRGIDLRLFYDDFKVQVRGCVRFDGGCASIGAGFLLPTHGGAIETCLDEATAELGKLAVFPFLATRKISFEIRKGVPVDVSLLVECTLVEARGVRCYVHGEILGFRDGAVYATCEAELINMACFL